jgi:hypothetical protein
MRGIRDLGVHRLRRPERADLQLVSIGHKGILDDAMRAACLALHEPGPGSQPGP